MKAVVFKAFGSANNLSVQGLDMSTRGVNEVRVRVSDCQGRRGGLRQGRRSCSLIWTNPLHEQKPNGEA